MSPINYMATENLPTLLKLAARVRLHSDYEDRLKVGAVLGRKGRPLSVGFNKNKTHPSMKFTIHAETDAIMNGVWGATFGSTMYVYRALQDNSPAMARPCDNCMESLKSCGIKKVVYSIATPPYFNIEKI